MAPGARSRAGPRAVSHPTLGAWDANWDPGKGVLFDGTQGTGKFCYGEGTDDPSLDGKPTPDGSIYCYDPDDSSKGTHGYPYVAKVWAYDANDLVRVRHGHLRPWRVRPYAVWTLHLPFR